MNADADDIHKDFIQLLPSNLTQDRANLQRKGKRPSQFALSNNGVSQKFNLRCETLRTKSHLGQRYPVGIRSQCRNQSIIFTSPTFKLPSNAQLPNQFDEQESDCDEPSVISSVSDYFNPYTSWESGSYTSSRLSSNDQQVDEVVSLVNTSLNMEEKTDVNMPYIS